MYMYIGRLYPWTREKNIVEKKGHNAGYRHFLLLPQCFNRSLSQGLDNSELFDTGLDGFIAVFNRYRVICDAMVYLI